MKTDSARFIPAFHDRHAQIAALRIDHADLQHLRDDALQRIENPADPTDFLDAVHQLQRLYYTSELHILDHPQIIAALTDNKNFPTWKDYAVLQATEKQRDILAQQLYDGYAPLGPIALFLGDYAGQIGERVLEQCLEHGDAITIWIDDRLFLRRMTLCLNDTGLVALGDLMARRYENVKRRIVALAESPSVPYTDQAIYEREKMRQAAFSHAMEKNGLWLGQKFTGSILPSRHDAEADEIDFDEYVRIFFAMCEVDLEEIDHAHKIMIDTLNKAETVHITNSDGTDITFGIKGMTFLNSLIEANIPGTEVFSAPEREKVNGIIVAKGLFYVPLTDEQPIRDITLEFKDGRIIRAEAAEGQIYLDAAINRDEGSHYLGELAFGTNPALTYHVSNPLLVEKIGGSFHVAIGHSYENQPTAIINNGNHSTVHWDITTMLRGKDGMIAVDGEIIMQGGVYLDPRLAYLNGKK